MSNTKEKLVELLKESKLCSKRFDDQYSDGTIAIIADHLIAHGVTLQEWITVTERLPEDLVRVMTCDEKGNIHIMLHHHSLKDPFNIGLNDLRYYPVTHWMPLPEPPKGE